MRYGPVLALFVLMPASAAVAQTIPVAAFHAVDVHGGGEVILHHGAAQRVTVVKGDAKTAEIRVDPAGTLHLSPCASAMGCFWHQGPFRVEVITPTITAINVHGGGEARADGTFPVQPHLSVSVHGGGEADLKAIQAQTVNANIHGGGEAKVYATQKLAAEVYGGGELRYWGHPSVSSSVHGGGSISRGD
ncbi:MAG: DUF2807 domain-containing protein [Alphaproteobacteria bacterium]|nr:DUF2807 domain-containing protein [Alphaproteobacteria bacterium]